ncbi:M-phase phosphoprotein [Parasponia andersonii]|uniref:M-phase phosphoprotein n=1 Tax=Parasponia andersonii TaxID=3476 RepID=A0A2P5DQJ8_PARAD|nr:M-phase phosphoprotein [Parasponia andersonii]
MAKREFSSTLRNLKFMQRAAQREEVIKKEEVKPAQNFTSQGSVTRKCVVIMEGDPHPEATKGRMSFQSFNPVVDKLNEEATKVSQPATLATSSGTEIRKGSIRENGSSIEGECSDIDKPKSKANVDHKRKQSEIVSKSQYPNKSPKSDQGDQLSSSKRKGAFKKPKDEKLDWSVLRRSKS